MKNQFWAGLGSQAVLVKKKLGADYEQLLRAVFLCFQKDFFFMFLSFFYGLKFECNLSVCT